MSRQTLIIDLSPPLEVIWKNIDRKRRGDIRRAERRGVTIETDTGYGDFRDMYRDIRRELNLPPWDISRLEMESCKMFLARAPDGEALAGELYMFCENRTRMRVKHITSKRYDPERKSMAGLAHALLIWESIKWAKKKRMKIYDFGGYNPTGVANQRDVTPVNRWKGSFGGIIATKVC